jgi:hypothetical protein
MSFYEQFSPDVVQKLKTLNEELISEEKKEIIDKQKILKLKQQILMKGLELSVNFNPYNSY